MGAGCCKPGGSCGCMSSYADMMPSMEKTASINLEPQGRSSQVDRYMASLNPGAAARTNALREKAKADHIKHYGGAPARRDSMQFAPSGRKLQHHEVAQRRKSLDVINEQRKNDPWGRSKGASRRGSVGSRRGSIDGSKRLPPLSNSPDPPVLGRSGREGSRAPPVDAARRSFCENRSDRDRNWAENMG